MMKTFGSGGNLQPVTVVLVTDQFGCKRLITAGRRLADRDGTRLEVVNVASPGVERNPEAIEYLFQVSRENDAAMTIHYSDAPARFLGELIQEKCPAAVVTACRARAAPCCTGSGCALKTSASSPWTMPGSSAPSLSPTGW